jgi:alkylation response protein AidB-like acyl-CoA dehydrogenase
MMDWLTEDQRALRDMAQKFARKEVAPLANRIDIDEHTPDSLIAKAAEIGLFGLYTSPDYGGSGADLVAVCLVAEEIAKASPSFAGALTVQMVLCPAAVQILGTEEQKQRLLPRSASGERLIAYSQSEPAGAANVAAHITRLEPDGTSWRLDGAKLFCTQSAAKTYLVMCRTRDHDGRQGYGCIIVEREAAGFNVGPYEHKLGWRGTNTGPISFTNVQIESKDILGSVLSGGIDHRRANHANVLAHAATSLGCMQGMFDQTLDYVKERRLYGKEMWELQPIGYWLAEAHAKIAACRALLYANAQAFDRGAIEAAMPNVCKAYICETAFDVCCKLLPMWGGSGIMNSTGVHRYMRDAKANTIAEGASEMHYAIIANQILHGVPSLARPASSVRSGQ